MNRLILLVVILLTSNSSAEENLAHVTKVLVQDVGVMGLASRDLFAWDHKTKTNKENGRLDLSTIFGNDIKGYYVDGAQWYEQKHWEHLGNKKNSENAPVYTITQQLVSYFNDLIKEKVSPENARLQTIAKFNDMVKISFSRLTGLDYPKPFASIADRVTNQEQAAMRILHDILPGQIKLTTGEIIKVTDYKTAKTVLCDADLNCEIKIFDGDYDPEYNKIKLPVKMFGMIPIVLDLEKIDNRFITKAGMDPELAAQELLAVGKGEKEMEDTSFGHLLTELFTKAQSTLNYDGSENIWIKKLETTFATVK